LVGCNEERELLESGFGITCFCRRTTARADELSTQEYIEGGRILVKKIEKYTPKILAVLGITAFRLAFRKPKAKPGLQTGKIGGATVWLLPNPSGLNAYYQLNDLAGIFAEVRDSIGN
jgi:TDG/mug DNA glycosylase family protein